jgi:hypothetical protein
MALAFEKARLTITNESGRHDDIVPANFDRDIKEVNNKPVVDVAIQSFKLDLAGTADPTDIVQVTASIDSASGRSVSVRFRTEYSGGRYSGEVIGLVIADLI